MNVRRLQLDVDKAVQRPDLLELAEAIDAVAGVDAVTITVTDIDIPGLVQAIERAGAALHSIDEIVVGQRATVAAGSAGSPASSR